MRGAGVQHDFATVEDAQLEGRIATQTTRCCWCGSCSCGTIEVDCGGAAVFAALASAATNVRDFGAKGDGVAKDTAAIQRAIDATVKPGRGTVLLPAGRYLSGTVHFRSNITLHLENGAILLASPDEADFDPYETLPSNRYRTRRRRYFHYGLIVAEGVHDIGSEGKASSTATARSAAARRPSRSNWRST